MADPLQEDTAAKKRGLRLPILMGFALAGLGGGGAYWAVSSGPFAPMPEVQESDANAVAESVLPRVETAFVPLETVIISLGPDETGRHLIFTAELEVDPEHEDEVMRMRPRVLDVLNGYLRVISLSELADPRSLAQLRAQMLRRVQVVMGPGRVHDLLVTQFVVN